MPSCYSSYNLSSFSGRRQPVVYHYSGTSAQLFTLVRLHNHYEQVRSLSIKLMKPPIT